MIRIAQSEIEKDGYYNYELKSITSLENPNVTFVVVNVGFIELSLEIDNKTGKILSKEKIAR